MTETIHLAIRATANRSEYQKSRECIPIFFIIVAILICLTTMTRMVEEERTYMGVLLALGYTERHNGKVSSLCGNRKHIGLGYRHIYGLYFFPYAIFKAYELCTVCRRLR